MKNRVFVDSNIWIYTVDPANPERKAKAIQVVKDLIFSNTIVVSTQVMNEVYFVLVKKLGINPMWAKDFVRNLREYDLVLVDPDVIELAMDFSVIEQISYWDALMIAAAQRARCSRLLTEDMQTGRTIQGIQIVNPFLSN